MSDTPRTNDAQFGTGRVSVDFARQLKRKLTAAQAEIARLKAGGCARDQRTTQFCGEALNLQEENDRLHRLLSKAEIAIAFANREPGVIRMMGDDYTSVLQEIRSKLKVKDLQ